MTAPAAEAAAAALELRDVACTFVSRDDPGQRYTAVRDVEARTARIDNHLTDIMMAQDFHDLTGQVVAKVVTLANDLEDSLLKLLVSVVPPDQREKVDASILNGPVVNAEGRTDVVSNQGEVDDLLASLGF